MSELIFGINPVREALAGHSRTLHELMVSESASGARIAELVKLAEKAHLQVTVAPRAELDRCAGHRRHQGVLLRLSPFRYASLDDLLSAWQRSGRSAFFLLLDGVTDPRNFGAILRSAEGAGCHGVIVPKDRCCPVTPVVEKTAAGALAHLPLCRVTNLARTLEQLKRNGLWCYGLAGEGAVLNLYRADLTGDLALVIGSEGEGLRANVRTHCDRLLAIPMRGHLDSLNASVAAGIALYEVVRQTI